VAAAVGLISSNGGIMHSGTLDLLMAAFFKRRERPYRATFFLGFATDIVIVIKRAK
jgi:predicted membrane channel-forming protein YqfA (hemolysin III family)